MKKYMIELDFAEQKFLREMISQGTAAARKMKHAQILLKADESDEGPAWIDEDIADAFEVSVRTVERIRKRCVEDGLEEALVHRKNPNGVHRRKLDGHAEAHLTKLACRQPPEGRERWTLRLLSDQMIELQVVDTVSYETVRTMLKKTRLSPG